MRIGCVPVSHPRNAMWSRIGKGKVDDPSKICPRYRRNFVGLTGFCSDGVRSYQCAASSASCG